MERRATPRWMEDKAFWLVIESDVEGLFVLEKFWAYAILIMLVMHTLDNLLDWVWGVRAKIGAGAGASEIAVLGCWKDAM